MFKLKFILIILLLAMNLLYVKSNELVYDKCEYTTCPKLTCKKSEIIEVKQGSCCGYCKSICLEMCKDVICPNGFYKAKILGSCCEICVEHREVNYDNIPSKNNNNNNNYNDNNNNNNNNKGNVSNIKGNNIDKSNSTRH